ncbi:Glycogen synthase [Porphyridium purpureum]|uniref:Glycogen synthase n=1 Tax=Porphyridium purpureum TaxID=35688 RepID=A0A5J4Z6A3_PORPP|nr:Glycogen synthase [Porphyridium purpureum]|eukprot:POR7120..scf295_1
MGGASRYDKWVQTFVGKNEAAIAEAMAEIEVELLSVQRAGYASHAERVSLLETMLVCLLGHRVDNIRERAVVLLNVLYDGHDLQLTDSLTVQIASVDVNQFLISVPLSSGHGASSSTAKADPSSVKIKVFGPTADLYAPPKWVDVPVERTKDGNGVQCALPAFSRPGFYDWALVPASMSSTRVPSSTDSLDPAVAAFDHRRCRGRVIVQPAGVRDEYLFEAPVDQVGASWDESTGALQDLGNFDRILEILPDLKMKGVTGVYVMGALERPVDDPDAAPFNVADRASVCSKVGGEKMFAHLTSEMRSLGLKPIIDGFDRVSRGFHRKYRKFVVDTLNQRGVPTPHPGTDARENQWSDSVLLNYRRVEVWDLLVQELKVLARKYGVRGVRLDNAQSYPLILAEDPSLYRRDPDGEMHYSMDEIFFGQIVKPNAECAYWTTGACLDLNYPNPFLIKVVREMWNEFPNFLVIGESHFHREIELVQSGLIVHSFRVAQILASLSGRTLRRDGSVARIPMSKRSTARTLTKLYKNERDYMPKDPVMVQSSCFHTTPYPGGLYGRKAWMAVDLLYFLPGIPMLLFGEDKGQSVRLNMMSYANHEETSAYDVNYDLLLPKSPPKKAATPANASPTDGVSALATGMRKVMSASNLANSPLSLTPVAQLVASEGGAGKGMRRVSSKGQIAGKLSTRGSVQDLKAMSRTGSVTDFKSPLIRNRSKDDLKGMAVRSTTATDVANLSMLNKQLYEEIGPHAGFDLTRIKGHYDHRELIRHEYPVFSKGSFCVLGVEPLYREQIFAFARFTHTQFVIVVMNLKDVQDGEAFKEAKDVSIFLQPLADSLPDSYTSRMNHLFSLKDVFTGEKRADGHLFTLEELIFRRMNLMMEPLHTCIFEVCEADSSAETSALHLKQCVHRLHAEGGDMKDPRENTISALFARSAAKGMSSFAAALLQVDTMLRENHIPDDELDTFLQLALQRASGLYYNVIYEGIEAPRDFEPPKGDRIIAYLLQLAYAAREPRVKTLASNMLKRCQNIGPLVFVCPEYGRFSTAGGLGVMVDELTKDLADLGLEIYVISPYYTVNRKNQTGYLGPGFNWTRNLDINVGTHVVTVGVWEGKEEGVNMIFLERGDFFPKVYADAGSQEKHLQSIVLMSLASLEVMCHKAVQPAVFVTNDWMPSMAAAYAKQGFFGSYFDDTTFFHLIHNLGSDYEGRCYPSPQQGDMSMIHRLPTHLLIDPWWAQTVVNPSRCALMCSDSWGTVSPSYLRELKESHALKHIMLQCRAPFGYPNGIRQAHREQLLLSKGAENHTAAKRILQQKYFGFRDLDDSIPLFAFVGRVTSQKGVHMILNAVDELIQFTGGRLMVLVGGPATWSDPYSAGCARHMQDLRNRHHDRFWADPDAFFLDGPLVNLGADFGVMPSLFEPGGIVQQEFFVAGTPVVAFKTGGLKDTVHEWNPETGDGNGFLFDGYNHNDFMWAMKRALRTFSRRAEYEELRQNAYDSTIDVSQVAWAWSSEFHRLRGAIFAIPKGIATELGEAAATAVDDGTLESSAKVVTFEWKNAGGVNRVEMKGSFDNWQRSSSLVQDPSDDSKFIISMRLPRGTYQFKFRVDGQWLLNDKYERASSNGMENNVFTVE